MQTLPLSPGSRCIVLHHPDWAGGKLQCYEGAIVHASMNTHTAPYPGYTVSFPWLKKLVFLPLSCVCPVYNDCEDCGYAAWSAIERKDGWHHYCAWCVSSHAA